MSPNSYPSDGTQGPETEGLLTRRRLIRMGAVALIGGLLLAAVGLLDPTGGKRNTGRTVAQSSDQVLAAPSTSLATQPGTVRVKAVYFQMKEVTDVGQDYYELVAPASLGDLMNAVQSNYPMFATMRLSMSTLVDGQVATYATPLRQGDEVDFIPMIQGG